MEMLVVFKGFSTFFAAGAGVGAFAVVVDVDATGTEFVPDGVGVPVRLGWALTVKSLPWVSMIAPGNSANLVSRATGSLDFANLNKASTTGLDEVVSDHSYYGKSASDMHRILEHNILMRRQNEDSQR